MAEPQALLREETSQAACDALHRGQLDCVLLAMPFACGDVDIADLFDDRAVRRLPARRGAGRRSVDAAAIDEDRLLLLEDGHCLKDHALAACNRPDLRAEATMMGTSLHTLVQMVDNGLGLTFVPAMAIDAGHPRRHAHRRPAAAIRAWLPPDRAGLARVEPARGGISAARRRASQIAASIAGLTADQLLPA